MNNRDVLENPSVLVLNKLWIPINTRTVADAITQLFTGVAQAVDVDGSNMFPVSWKQWMELPVREHDQAIHTPSRTFRAPTLIVLGVFAEVRSKEVKFSNRAVYERDGGVCQYSGKKLKRSEASVDHVHPRYLGGKDGFENCVLADRKINSTKGHKTLDQAGLKLRRRPFKPSKVPVCRTIVNSLGIPDWELILHKYR